MTTAEQIEALITGQTDLIRQAAGRVATGAVPDITGIERDAAKICTMIDTVDDSEAKSLEASLAVMIGALEELITALYSYQDELAATGDKQEKPL